MRRSSLIGSRNQKQISIRLAAACSAVGLSALALAPGLAAASTISIKDGNYGDGVSLSAANVLAASAPVGVSSSYTFQGVNFATPTEYNSTGTTLAPGTTTGVYSGSVTSNGVTITVASLNSASTPVAMGINPAVHPPSYYNGVGFQYTTNSDTNNGVSNNSTLASPQPAASGDTQNLSNLLNTVVDFATASTNSMTVTFSGLTPNTQYAIDLIESTIGYGARTETLTYSGAASDPSYAVYLYGTGTSPDPAYGFGYDSHDVVTAVGSTITLTINNSSGAIFNAVAISAVPEPASLGLVAAAGAVGLTRRRRSPVSLTA